MTESEYLAIGSYGTQLLSIMYQLEDFDLSFKHISIFSDNTRVINLSKYTVHHSRAKHIDIKHHFIHDHVEKGDFILDFINIKNQLADIFTKPLREERFSYLLEKLNVISFPH